MDYEKKYNDAVIKAKTFLNRWSGLEVDSELARKELMAIFPELKESEDERIRKEIIKYLEERRDQAPTLAVRDKWIAWLEKQGEQKPAEWTIKNAKDGDVLNSMRVQATIIFKGFADDGKHIIAYCALQKGIFIKQEMLWDRDFEPASEYWKNALYDAMVKEGYEWDAEKKELKKIEQKSAWSEEDENHVKSILSTIECCKAQFPNAQAVVEAYNADIEWLKSLRLQNRWKPSEEQIKALKVVVGLANSTLQRTLESLYNDLKKL